MKATDTKAVIGRVFEIERYAINDGPGIRTLIFLKGCGLACVWCSNPESQSSHPQLVHYVKKCLRCEACVSICERDALSLESGGIVIRRDRCDGCGACVSVCNTGALVLLGKSMTPEEAFSEVLKDEPFYRRSGGGVTFSGGEPLMQGEFVLRVAKLCKKHYIHTAIETCGFASWETFERLLPAIDLFLYDLKEMDPERHNEYTGVDNDLILENFERLAGTGKEIIVRVPVIPGHNDRDENFEMIIDFIRRHVPGCRVDLLPYHRLGKPKYDRLGMPYIPDSTDPPSPSRMESLKKEFAQAGFQVSIGG
ncbi:MAG: glycyl-radical enzyme activating protein [Spirochaetes bacterium]|nr:glycyl-radical enzyme activating protein [Spirochaetota bacterium]